MAILRLGNMRCETSPSGDVRLIYRDGGGEVMVQRADLLDVSLFFLTAAKNIVDAKMGWSRPPEKED